MTSDLSTGLDRTLTADQIDQLVSLVGELGEVQKVASDILLHGYDVSCSRLSDNCEGTVATNRVLFKKKLGNALETIQLLLEYGEIPTN